MSTDKVLLRKIVEGALLAAGQPLSISKIAGLFDPAEEAPAADEIQAVLADIQADCGERGFELKEVGTGWRFQVREETAPWVNRLWEEKPQKYSRALLETLALVAYRQPITRGDIEEIRGVAVSSQIMKTLSEREWIKVVGHRDVPGRPALYATTRQFLDYFNLTSLEDLPSLSEISDLDKLNPELELDITGQETGDNEGQGEDRNNDTTVDENATEEAQSSGGEAEETLAENTGDFSSQEAEGSVLEDAAVFIAEDAEEEDSIEEENDFAAMEREVDLADEEERESSTTDEAFNNA